MNSESKSCANCIHLSRTVQVEFENHKTEQRVVCLEGQWERGSINYYTIYAHAGKFRARAESCKQYAAEKEIPSHNATD